MKKQNRLFGLALAFSLILGTAGCQKAEEPKKEDKTVETDKTKTSKKSEENKSDKKDAKSSIKEDETKSDAKTNNGSSSSNTSSNTNKSNSGTSTTKPSTSQNTAKSSGNTKSNTATNTNKNTSTNNTGSGSTKTNTSQNNTKTETKPSEPAKPAHTHSWTNVTKTVHHAEQGHNEQVLVQDAYDEPTYSDVEHSICNQCGVDITGGESAHNKAHALAGEAGGWHSQWVSEQTETVHHDAVYQTTYVVDTPAYDETVVTGQQCSGCGATK